jgi:hypothetical protein
VRLFQSKEKKQEAEAARSSYAEFALAAASSEPEQARALAATFKQNPTIASLSDKERRELGGEAFRTYADNLLADDLLSAEEEEAFGEVTDAFGITDTDFQTTFGDVRNRLVIARMNDGRLNVIEAPHVMTKKDELVHLETAAQLMKETAVREWRGGTSGFSFRVAKGVSYRTGAIRGRSVVVGTELKAVDSGILAVTSRRVAYMGNKTMEMQFSKLMNIEVFSDGVRIQVSNRQNAPLFKLDEGLGEVVAATVNAAMQDFEQ